jgi:hypothetical protein
LEELIILKNIVLLLVQLILAGPILLYFPFAIFIGIGTYYLIFTGDLKVFDKMLVYGLGWLGIIGLYGSILLPMEYLKTKKWVRRIIVMFIIFGYVSTVILFLSLDKLFRHETEIFTYWLLGGPVAVATWNICRIYIDLTMVFQMKK